MTAAKIIGYDSGTAAGLMAGAFTESTVIGTAGETIERLDLPAEEKQRLLNNIPVAYAVSYLVGTGFVVWFLSSLAPRLLKVDLKAESRKLEASLAGPRRADAGGRSAYPRMGPAGVSHRRQAPLGRSQRGGVRAVVRAGPRVRRARPPGGRDRGADTRARRSARATRWWCGARRNVLLARRRDVGEEVDDRELLNFPVCRDGRRAHVKALAERTLATSRRCTAEAWC